MTNKLKNNLQADFNKNSTMARHRLGTSPRQYLEWVLKFRKCALRKLDENKLKALRHEASIYATGTFSFSMEGAVVSLSPGLGWGNTKLERIPSESELVIMQSMTVDSIERFLEYKLVDAKMDIEVRAKPLGPGERGGYIGIYPKSNLDAFNLSTIFLIGIFAEKIRSCREPTCKNLYIAKRVDQLFCTVKCQNRLAARRARNTPPERIGKRGRPLGSKNKS